MIMITKVLIKDYYRNYNDDDNHNENDDHNNDDDNNENNLDDSVSSNYNDNVAPIGARMFNDRSTNWRTCGIIGKLHFQYLL